MRPRSARVKRPGRWLSALLSVAALVLSTVSGALAPPTFGSGASVVLAASTAASPTGRLATVLEQSDLPVFPETGFAIANTAFADYFAKRGGLRTFGYPVSNGFLLLGTPVQLFQRQVMQLRPDGSVGTLNILDGDIMPYTRINGSVFPAVDPVLLAQAPDPGAPNYGIRVLQFANQHTPDAWNGLMTNFRQTFLNTVRYEEAFPDRAMGPGIMPSINLELWGIPTSAPAFDPSNTGFVYLRFQRGIMHFDASTNTTQGLLLADYLKAILTGENLPPDLEAQASSGRFYRQYDPNRPRALARPDELPGTDLTGAFGSLPGPHVQPQSQLQPQPPTQVQPPTQPAPPQATGAVPAEYQRLYDTLRTDLERFDALLHRQPITPYRSLTFGAELSSANCNQGPRLFDPSTMETVRLQLDALKRLGVEGVTHCLHYPLLLPSFPNSDRYLAFYKAVAEEIRKRGLKHAIDLQVIFSGSTFSNLTVDFSDLTFDNYVDRKAMMAQAIIDQLAPDYLSLGGEPDTEARLTGMKELNDPVKHTEFLQRVLAKVDRKTTKLGAGSGTWVSPQFARNYAANTSIDFIDIHIYPMGEMISRNTLQIADIARQYNKKIVIYEAWLYKTTGIESANTMAANETVFARDVYSFWQPLDQLFIKNIVAFANLEQVEYVSFFWTPYFFSYLNHNQANANRSSVQLVSTAAREAQRNMATGVLTGTGEFYRDLIRAHRGSA
jgi:hypothetical protein